MGKKKKIGFFFYIYIIRKKCKFDPNITKKQNIELFIKKKHSLQNFNILILKKKKTMFKIIHFQKFCNFFFLFNKLM